MAGWMPQIWKGFQTVEDGTGTYDFPVNFVLLATILLILTTLVSASSKLMARIISVGVFVVLFGAVSLIIALETQARGRFRNPGTGSGQPLGFFGVFLIAAMASGLAMYGFETTSSLGEKPRTRREPRLGQLSGAPTAASLIVAALILCALLAAPNVSDHKLGEAAGGLQHIILLVLGGNNLPFSRQLARVRPVRKTPR